MTLDKAIEILNDLLGEGKPLHPHDRIDAVKLGIEALVHVRADRRDPQTLSKLLPGETEELQE